MRLLADENIPAPLVRELRDQGLDIRYVADMEPGISDSEVLSLSVNEKRPILTEDRDFGELVFRRGYRAYGVILLRLPVANRGHWPRIGKLLLEHQDRLDQAFAVIGKSIVRFRRLP